MVKNKQVERDEVLKPCLNLCNNLLRAGAILQYRRLDALDKDHKVGSPDIEIHLLRGDTLWILMAECKKPVGGILSPGQRQYRDRYKVAHNVIYRVFTSKLELSQAIEELTGFYKNIFEGMPTEL